MMSGSTVESQAVKRCKERIAVTRTKFFITTVTLLILLFVAADVVWAIDYYVDQNHPNASDQNIGGTIDQPWKTITKANQILTGGDTVYIRTGNYNSYIAPNNSGTSSRPITYKNYGSDTVTISNTTYGIFLSGKSYIVVQGINFYNLDKFLWLQNSANHNTIANCNFDQGRSVGWSGSKIWLSSSHNWIHHCQFSKYGYFTSDDIGSILDIGDEESSTDMTSHNLIENNVMFHGGHHILGIYGTYNVIRNNYFHNEIWSIGYGNRNVYLSGYPANSGWNLIEGNRIGYSAVPPDNWGSNGMALSTGYNIVRRNAFFYNDLSGIGLTVTSNYYADVVYNKIYNNTFLHNGWNTECPDALCSAIGFAVYSGSLIVKYNDIKNNLYYDHYQTHGTYRVNLSDQILAGNWNGDVQGDPKFVNANKAPGDPMNANLPDLRIQSGSPCIDAGTYLTTVVSSSGSGSSFQVADSRYFVDGWGITEIQGDEIQLFGTSQKARIIAINYSTNTITVDRNITWIQNQGVALAYEGIAPDAGAHELGKADVPSPPKNLRLVSS